MVGLKRLAKHRVIRIKCSIKLPIFILAKVPHKLNYPAFMAVFETFLCCIEAQFGFPR